MHQEGRGRERRQVFSSFSPVGVRGVRQQNDSLPDIYKFADRVKLAELTWQIAETEIDTASVDHRASEISIYPDE